MRCNFVLLATFLSNRLLPCILVGAAVISETSVRGMTVQETAKFLPLPKRQIQRVSDIRSSAMLRDLYWWLVAEVSRQRIGSETS